MMLIYKKNRDSFKKYDFDGRKWILSVILILMFLLLSYYVVNIKTAPWDVYLMLKIHALSHPWLDHIMLWVTETGSELGVIFLAILEIYFIYRHKLTEAAIFLTNFLVAVSINSLIKEIFARPRPRVFPPLVVYHTDSFPSGHTIAAISLYGLLAIYLWDKNKKFPAIFSAIWALLVGFSRVYLGAHYPSDVLGAVILGSIFLTVSWGFLTLLRND